MPRFLHVPFSMHSPFYASSFSARPRRRRHTHTRHHPHLKRLFTVVFCNRSLPTCKKTIKIPLRGRDRQQKIVHKFCSLPPRSSRVPRGLSYCPAIPPSGAIKRRRVHTRIKRAAMRTLRSFKAHNILTLRNEGASHLRICAHALVKMRHNIPRVQQNPRIQHHAAGTVSRSRGLSATHRRIRAFLGRRSELFHGFHSAPPRHP